MSNVKELVCAHHWLIAPAVMPVSEGTCCLCGDVREFNNSPDSLGWDSDYLRSFDYAAPEALYHVSREEMEDEGNE